MADSSDEESKLNQKKSLLNSDEDETATNDEEKKTSGAFDEEGKSFKELGLCEELCAAVDELGYKHPTKIQRESLPYSLQGKDIIGLAETGSGKTASFALPVIQSLLANPQRNYALVLAPTRELSIGIAEQFEALGAKIGLKTCVLVGGLDITQQAMNLSRNRPHIIVGTPGRVADHLENTKGFNLKGIKYLILDEADKLLEMDFEKQINQIVGAAPRTRSTYLYSATMTNKVSKLQRASLKNPVKIEVSSKYQTVDKLEQNFLFVPALQKDCYLAYVLNEYAGNSIMVFAATCLGCQRMTLMLRNLGFKTVPLHGQMNQTKRLGALNKFKSGDKSILISTDVASRGLDIPSVNLVINYDIPGNAKNYIHRVGRTARGGRSGRSISIVTQYDVENFQRIEYLMGKKIDLYKTEEESVLMFQERVEEAKKVADLQLKDFTENKKGRLGDYDKDEEEDNQPEYKKNKFNKGKGGKKRPGNFKKSFGANKRQKH